MKPNFKTKIKKAQTKKMFKEIQVGFQKAENSSCIQESLYFTGIKKTLKLNNHIIYINFMDTITN